MESKRRVLLYRSNFLPYSETFIYDQIQHHSRYEVTVLARRHYNAERFPCDDVLAVEELPAHRHPLRSALFGLCAYSPQVDRELDKRRFALVHAHFAHNGIHAMRIARHLGVPLVVSLHGNDVAIMAGPQKFKPEWWHVGPFKKLLFANADLFLAASSDLKELFVSCGGPAEKCRVHRLGIDLSRFSPPPPRPESAPLTVLMVGRFVEKKGHLFGLRAAAKALTAGLDFRLVLVGDGALLPQYRKTVTDLGIQSIVDFKGSLPAAEVGELMRRCDVMLAPSVVAKNLDRESGLIVAKEAAACGLPVIGTYHGGIPEIIDDGQTGFLVPERDVLCMGERLITLLRDAELRRRMGLAARKKMEAEYDIRERMNELEAIYDQML